MSFYSDASLVMIPSGYKASKVYSAVPTDGLGDLVFTRALDTATRVGADGLIEKVRTNLLPSSNDISIASTYWRANQSGTTTQNAAVAPDGTTTAALITPSGVGAFSGVAAVSLITLAAVPHTFSVYLKTNSGTASVTILVLDAASTFQQIVVTATTTYTRFSLTFTPAAGAAEAFITSSGALAWLAWGAQLESSDIATTLIPTTTAAVSVGMLANVPRLDYLGGGCPKLLLEPQRTNTARNAQITAATWDKSNLTVTAASGIAPTGFNEAYRVAPTTSGTDRFFYDNDGSISYTASADYTNTIFAKANGLNFCYARFEIKGNTSSFVYFNLATGVVGSTFGAVPIVKSIENYGNGWYRIRVTGNMGTGIGGSNNVLFGICDADGSTFATASGTNSVLFFGPQSEEGSYPTSYIPTLGAAVTRSADAASKTGISALIGQTEGTLFVDMNYTNTNNTADATPFRVLGSGSAQLYVEINTNETFEAVVVNSAGTLVFNSISAAQVAGGKKMAIAYKGSDFAYYINGIQIAVQTSGAFASASLDSLNLGMYSSGVQVLADTINQALIFPTRLTNAQLAELTA